MTPLQRLWYEAASRAIVEAEEIEVQREVARKDDDAEQPFETDTP